MLTDALPEAQAHVAGDQTHIFRDPVVVHEITREPFDRGRVLARRHVDDIVLHEIGDHGDAIAAPAAGLVDADGLHTHVVLQPPRLVDAMGDGPPQTGVGLVQLLGERADGQVAGHLHGPRLEQEREPAAGPGPRGGHRHHPAPKPPTTNSERPKISDETRNTDLTKNTARRGMGQAIPPVLVDDTLEARTREGTRPSGPPPLRRGRRVLRAPVRQRRPRGRRQRRPEREETGLRLP